LSAGGSVYWTDEIVDTRKNFACISASFDEVKGKLDPAFSYLIVRAGPGSSIGEHIWDIKDKIECFRPGSGEEVVYHDESTGENFLVIKIDSDIRDNCIQEFMDLNLAKDMTIYIFSDSPER
jgi:hypothetical protein